MTIIKKYIWTVIYWFLGNIAPRLLVSVHFRRSFHRSLNWKHPRDINEKIQWLKFHADTSTWSDYADKYIVRKHLEDLGLHEMLVPLIGVWNKAEDINWEALPDKFVMKTNHGSGDALICSDKSTLDYPKWEKYFANLLSKKFGKNMGEPHYDKIHPRIIAEELLDCTKQSIPSSSLIDYKIFCFNGEPAYIWVCYNRTKTSCEVGVYDLDWRFHPEFSVSKPHYILSSKPIPRPSSLDKMLKAASILGKGYAVLRADFYNVDNKPYFGEMTFTPAAGFNDFFSDAFLNILGDKCLLPQC
ncbi:MAG: glycosyltransferase [Prevotella sp.]|nr:glycosyltransferase [Prevotella sp.]